MEICIHWGLCGDGPSAKVHCPLDNKVSKIFHISIYWDTGLHQNEWRVKGAIGRKRDGQKKKLIKKRNKEIGTALNLNCSQMRLSKSHSK